MSSDSDIPIDAISHPKSAFEQIIHDYLMDNPDVVIEALRGAEDKLRRNSQTSQLFEEFVTAFRGARPKFEKQGWSQ